MTILARRIGNRSHAWRGVVVAEDGVEWVCAGEGHGHKTERMARQCAGLEQGRRNRARMGFSYQTRGNLGTAA